MALDLDAIEARANAAATEGPWVQGGRYDGTWQTVGPGSGGVITSTSQFYAVSAPSYNYADAEFVAHAREDVPALIAEVRRLSQRPTVEQMAYAVEAAWRDPTWDNKTLRPIDRRIARYVAALFPTVEAGDPDVV